MTSALALVLAPLAALVLQTLMFTLVLPSCASQSALGLHAAAVVALVFTTVLALLANSERRHLDRTLAADNSGAAGVRSVRRFVSNMATAIAALSALVVAAMWFGAWVLSPCHPWP